MNLMTISQDSVWYKMWKENSIVIAMSLGIIITMILWGIGKKSHKVLSEDDS